MTGESEERAIMTETNNPMQRAAQIRQELLRIISGLSVERLAVAARHDHDEEAGVVVPPDDSPGATFLQRCRDAFVDWVQLEGRFPEPSEAANACGDWHREQARPSLRARAFVELGLFYSGHALAASDASITGITQALDSAAESLAFTLTMEYGPMV
jgi:hypothetical protein